VPIPLSVMSLFPDFNFQQSRWFGISDPSAVNLWHNSPT
jgi:hypothetical protein